MTFPPKSKARPAHLPVYQHRRQDIEFSDGFTDLHTETYREILEAGDSDWKKQEAP
jgi:hypothetical protein